MAFCGRGWSERALDPDPHDLLVRGWAALDTERNQHYRTLQTMVIVARIALPLGAWAEGCRLACYPPANLRGRSPRLLEAAAWSISRRPVFARRRPPPYTLATVREARP